MIDILFKGMLIETKEWAIGSLVKVKSGACYIVNPFIDDLEHQAENVYQIDGVAEVDPETVEIIKFPVPNTTCYLVVSVVDGVVGDYLRVVERFEDEECAKGVLSAMETLKSDVNCYEIMESKKWESYKVNTSILREDDYRFRPKEKK